MGKMLSRPTRWREPAIAKDPQAQNRDWPCHALDSKAPGREGVKCVHF